VIGSHDRDFISLVRNIFSGRRCLDSEELFEHNSLACGYRARSNRRERRIKTETSIAHRHDGVHRAEPRQMSDTSINEFAVGKRQFALNRARKDFKPATIAVGSNLMN